MIDGLFSGLLGGLFGPAIAHWLSRYKYWAIFFVATLLTQALSITFMLKELGLEKTVEAFVNGINPAFFFAPMGIGVLAVFVAFIGSLNVPKDGDGPSSEDCR
jgi:Na+/H+ antiporter NhaC